MGYAKKIKNFGIGIDIEHIDRFRKLNLKDHKHFLSKVFTKSELNYCFSKKYPGQHLAVRYSAKSAIFKAASGIGKRGLHYRDIEIFNKGGGIPLAKINGKRYKNLDIKISLSHCKGMGMAFAIIIEAD